MTTHCLTVVVTGAGEREEPEWQQPSDANSAYDESPPSTPIRDFAPRGLPKLRKRFRDRLPAKLQVDIPARSDLGTITVHGTPIVDFLQFVYETVTSSIDHARSIGFLERLRLAIVQSQLLDNALILGPQAAGETIISKPTEEPNFHGLTASGAVAAAFLGASAAILIRWLRQGGVIPTWKRFFTSVLVLAVFFALGRTYVRRQILRNIQKRGLSEASTFFSLSRDFDAANGAALNFIMEVELVARGYRLSTPIPPISRLENNGQNVKCMQLRTAVRLSLLEIIPKYYQTALAIWGFAEQFQLAQLQSQYQFTLADVIERYQQTDFDIEIGQDTEKLQSLKDVAFLFHDIRKVFLGGILALHTDGTESDRARYTAISDAFVELNAITRKSLGRVQEVLAGTDMPAPIKTPKSPHSPRHDQWQHQVRRLSSMTMNIRSVQAKLHLLREESARSLDNADDITDLGPMFMSQYESIGQDLHDLMEAWQAGKATLASGINRNEKRLSSIGSVLASPSSTLSGLTIAEEGDSSQDEKDGVEAALRKLNGHMTPPEVEPEVFEAISLPRPRSMLSREERIIKMREDRQSKEVARAKADAHRGMMRELQGVIARKPAVSRMSL